jgi:hypothetical protein
VPHRIVNRNRMFGLERDQAVERGVGQPLALFESFLKHEAVSIARRLRHFPTPNKRTPEGVLG